MKKRMGTLLTIMTAGLFLHFGMTAAAAPEQGDGVSADQAVTAEDSAGSLSENGAVSENEVTDPQAEELKRILSGLSWNNWRIAYQEGVTEELMTVPYINKDGMIAYGMVKLYLPADTSKKVPLVFVPHYEAGEYSLEAVNYLQHGWAVASPLDPYGTIHMTLLEDDLVMNNAALYLLRHRPEIDPQRIALAGNSAGGYTALMLDALQLGNCACVANYAMVNPYYTFTQYFPALERENRKRSADTEGGIFPVASQVTACFGGIQDHMPAQRDHDAWTALSPIGLCSDLSCPVLENHYTSDLLIPVDEVTRLYAYPAGGETMPSGFDTHMGSRYPGVLGKSFTELLPSQATAIGRIRIETPFDEVTLPYDPAAFFNVNILDDGPVEAYSGHYAHADYVFRDDSVFLSDMFLRTLANTQILTADKAVLLLHRYMGDSPQLPVHYGVDETVYGSLTVYRSEITEGLAGYARDHSFAELEYIMQTAQMIYPQDTLIRQAWEELGPVIAEEIARK